MILQIINPFDPEERYDSLYNIPIERGAVLTAELELGINQPNQLTVQFTPQLVPEAYELIKEGQYGLRLIVDDIDMIFVQDSPTKKIDRNGIITVNFLSGVYKLKYNEPTNFFDQFVSQSGIVTANRIPGVEYQLISNDRTITLNAGINSNFDLLNELRRASGAWSYFDTGLKARGDGTYTNVVLLGEYSDIDKYGQSDKRFATENISTNILTNWVSDQPFLTDINQYQNGRQIQFLYPVLDTGQGGGSRNANRVFTQTNYDFIDPQFPLVNINGNIYIQDTRYTGISQRFYTYPVTLPVESFNQQQPILSLNDALAYLYRRSVYYLRTQTESVRFDCSLVFKKVTMPKKFKLNYQKNIRNVLGKKINVVSIDETILYPKLNYDLTKF